MTKNCSTSCFFFFLLSSGRSDKRERLQIRIGWCHLFLWFFSRGFWEQTSFFRGEALLRELENVICGVGQEVGGRRQEAGGGGIYT